MVAIWIPLLVGSITTVGTIMVHGAALAASLGFIRHQRAIGRAGADFWTDLRIVATVATFAMIAHLIEIGAWAILFVLASEFREWAVAFYHSAMNYTTLGYGDIVMSPAWRMLGPIEATDGLLMFGISTGMIFAVIQRLVRTRFADLRS